MGSAENLDALAWLILARLKAHHRGKRNAIKRPALLAYLRMIHPSTTDHKMRRAIEALRVNGVCSGNGGYYLASQDAEYVEGYRYLRSTGLACLAAASRLRDANPEKFQGRLFDTEAAT